MFLKSLYLQDFRLFQECRFSFSHKCNVFYGNNGVGKTSLLEAIGYISRGKSFRTSSSKKLIRTNKDRCIISVELEKANLQHRIGTEIHRTNSRLAQINGKPTQGFSFLATLIPLIWVNFSNLHLFLATPSLRRQFLDWGVFHHFPDFYLIWKKFNKVLQQRNMALRKQQSDKQVGCWDKDFITYASAIDQMRQNYVTDLRPMILNCMNDFLDLPKVSFDYDKGWGNELDLDELLMRGLNNDRKLGYTYFGPHRADLKLRLAEGKMAQDFCSQGQHKLISYIFYIIQGSLFTKVHSHSPVFLLDDLPSELDSDKIVMIANLLSKLKSQVFVSGVSKDDLKAFCLDTSNEMFHVKHPEFLS